MCLLRQTGRSVTKDGMLARKPGGAGTFEVRLAKALGADVTGLRVAVQLGETARVRADQHLPLIGALTPCVAARPPHSRR